MAGVEDLTTGNDVIDSLRLLQANTVYSDGDTTADMANFMRVASKVVGAEELEGQEFMVSAFLAFGRNLHDVSNEPEFFTDYCLEGTVTGVDFLSTSKPPIPIESLVVNIVHPTLLFEDQERVARASRLLFQVPILAITTCINK